MHVQIELSEFGGLTEEVLGKGPVADEDIRHLHRKCEWYYKKIFKRNNKLVYSIGAGQKKGNYVWDHEQRLWRLDEKGVLTNDAITITMLNIVERAMFHEQITRSLGKSLVNKFANIKIIRNMKCFIDYPTPRRFCEELDCVKKYFPIKGGRKICLETKEITGRTIKDYFSYELDRDYLPNLDETNNVFANFLRSVWIKPEEYEFWKLIHAILMLGETQGNYLIIWLHHVGGGGKTVWINSLQACLSHKHVTKLDREIFFRNCKKTKGFELAKLCEKRIAYVDEVATDGDASAGSAINLKVSLDITGGGFRSELDKYQRASSMIAKKQTATLCLMGNSCFFISDKAVAPLNRRVICARSERYFRARKDELFNEDDPNCGVKDPGLWDRINDNLDHVFTFLVNCVYDYIQQGKPDLHAIQPTSFKRAWKDLNGVFEGAKTRFITEYLAECDNEEGESIELTEFIRLINGWLKCKYKDTNIKITASEVKELLRKNEYGLRHPMRIRFLYENPDTKTLRKFYVLNCKVPEEE